MEKPASHLCSEEHTTYSIVGWLLKLHLKHHWSHVDTQIMTSLLNILECLYICVFCAIGEKKIQKRNYVSLHKVWVLKKMSYLKIKCQLHNSRFLSGVNISIGSFPSTWYRRGSPPLGWVDHLSQKSIVVMALKCESQLILHQEQCRSSSWDCRVCCHKSLELTLFVS